LDRLTVGNRKPTSPDGRGGEFLGAVTGLKPDLVEFSHEGYIRKALSFYRSQNINTKLYQQKIQISLIWIEENSYYSSKDFMNYIKDITEIEEITKD
jgi:hypothetical protein